MNLYSDTEFKIMTNQKVVEKIIHLAPLTSLPQQAPRLRFPDGDDFDLDAIVKTPGGQFTPAVEIRQKLEKSAHQAVWGVD